MYGHYLRSARAAARKSVAFFSSANKEYRERWVVRSFLANLHVPHYSFQVRSEKHEPPDVRFRRAAFEVKEILDPGRKRHMEYKAHLAKVLNAKHPDEFMEQYTPQDITFARLVELVQGQVDETAARYGSTTVQKLDLLVYVDLKHIESITEVAFPIVGFNDRGFRSVSALKGYASLVISATKQAPDFIGDNLQKLSFLHAG